MIWLRNLDYLLHRSYNTFKKQKEHQGIKFKINKGMLVVSVKFLGKANM